MYGIVDETFSILARALSPKRDKVVLFTGGHLAQTLSKYTSSKHVTPVYFSSIVSKNPIDVFSIVFRGGYLASRLTGDKLKVNEDVVLDLVNIYLNHWKDMQVDLHKNRSTVHKA